MYETIYECEDVIVVMDIKPKDYEVCTIDSLTVQDNLGNE